MPAGTGPCGLHVIALRGCNNCTVLLTTCCSPAMIYNAVARREVALKRKGWEGKQMGGKMNMVCPPKKILFVVLERKKYALFTWFNFCPWFDYKPCQQDVCMLFSVMLTRLGAFPGRCCWNSSGGGVSPRGRRGHETVQRSLTLQRRLNYSWLPPRPPTHFNMLLLLNVTSWTEYFRKRKPALKLF